MQTVHDFARFKAAGRMIAMVTAYDAWSARAAAGSNVDALLVGDSVAMVVHGHPTTLTASVEMLALHTRAVVRAAGGKLVVADLPFLSYRKGLCAAMDAVETLITSGAQAVKLEGVDGHEDIVRHIVRSGVPVMGHIGLMPQHVHEAGGYRVQGRTGLVADTICRQARTLEDLGCFAIVIECVPGSLAARITSELQVPTIGIGAGGDTDGQILVFHDLLGVAAGPSPRFVRRYLDGESLVTNALNAYAADVTARRFPADEESYA